jgi:hypothetical protein
VTGPEEEVTMHCPLASQDWPDGQVPHDPQSLVAAPQTLPLQAGVQSEHPQSTQPSEQPVGGNEVVQVVPQAPLPVAQQYFSTQGVLQELIPETSVTQTFPVASQ